MAALRIDGALPRHMWGGGLSRAELVFVDGEVRRHLVSPLAQASKTKRGKQRGTERHGDGEQNGMEHRHGWLKKINHWLNQNITYTLFGYPIPSLVGDLVVVLSFGCGAVGAGWFFRDWLF